ASSMPRGSTSCACSSPEAVPAEKPILRTAPAPLFLLSRLVRQSGRKVVLTGEGSDEIPGGCKRRSGGPRRRSAGDLGPQAQPTERAIELVFQRIAQRASAVGGRAQPDPAQQGIHAVDAAALERGPGLERGAERDRNAVAVPDPVRVRARDVQRPAGAQLEDLSAVLVALCEVQVAVDRRSGEMLLQRLLGQHFTVARAEHADRLAAT